MALPKIDLPMYEMELPSTKEKIKFRPFTVKEEKILLVAQEAGDNMQQITAVKQVVNNCLVNYEVSDMAMFDLEYVMLVLRARSVDNAIMFGVTDPDTGEQISLEMDIDNIKVTRDEEHTNQVKINDDYTLFLRYPTIDEFISIAGMNQDDPLVSYYVLTSCLDKVASDDEVHYFKDYTQEEIDSFMENVSAGTTKGIQKFFQTMPKIRHEIGYTTKECETRKFTAEGLNSFFS